VPAVHRGTRALRSARCEADAAPPRHRQSRSVAATMKQCARAECRLWRAWNERYHCASNASSSDPLRLRDVANKMKWGSVAMTFKWSLVLSAAWLLAVVAFAQTADARVVKFQVEQRGPYLGGVSWGEAGPYEMLTGTAFMEVDPANPQDAIIVDVDHAPRNAQGRVEFSTPFVVLTPADPARRSRKLFFALNNRGNTQGGLIAPTSQAQMAETLAGAAMERGYTVVDAGWEGDIVPAARKLIANLPVAVQSDGSPITGLGAAAGTAMFPADTPAATSMWMLAALVGCMTCARIHSIGIKASRSCQKAAMTTVPAANGAR
jgi:hypothetical protein